MAIPRRRPDSTNASAWKSRLLRAISGLDPLRWIYGLLRSRTSHVSVVREAVVLEARPLDKGYSVN